MKASLIPSLLLTLLLATPPLQARGTKAYTLVADFTSGVARGELNARIDGCTFSQREESQGAYHLEFAKRGQSRLGTTFTCRSGSEACRVRLRIVHKATVSGQCPIDVRCNDRSVVQAWSPTDTAWHISSWDLSPLLHEGRNEIVLTLGQAPKMYWLRRLEVAGPSDALFPADGPIGPGGQWLAMLRDARRALDEGRRFAGQNQLERARQALQRAVALADRVASGATQAGLRQEASDLARQARFEVQQLAGGDGGALFDAAFRYCTGYTGLQLDKEQGQHLAHRIAAAGPTGLERFKALYGYAVGYTGLQLPKDEAIAFATKGLPADETFLSVFKTNYAYAVGYTGLQLPKPEAIELARDLSFFGTDALPRFKALYAYAAGYTGLQLPKIEAIAFARRALAGPSDYLDSFKTTYAYAVGYTGLQLPKERALDLAHRIALFGPRGLEQFKKDYAHAVGYTGMQLPKDEAIRFALERLEGNF